MEGQSPAGGPDSVPKQGPSDEPLLAPYNAPGPGSDDFNPNDHIWEGGKWWWSMDRRHWWDGAHWASAIELPQASSSGSVAAPERSPGPTLTGQYSSDGRWWWDGSSWRQTSPDRRWWWDEHDWRPTGARYHSRRLGLRGWAIVAGVGVLLAGATYSGSLFSHPPDLNCIGQATTIQPQRLSDGSLLFQGGHHPFDDIYFSAPMTLTSTWTVSWQSGRGQFILYLYDATASAPSHSSWNTWPDNQTGLVASLVDSPAPHAPYAGSAVESKSGKFCLTIRAIAEDQTSADPWTVTVTPG